MNKEEVKKNWENWVKVADCDLNPDSKHVDIIAEGVLKNEEKFGLRLCPCRIRDSTRKRDLELICPCNFQVDKTWAKKGQCWCGLFIKK